MLKSLTIRSVVVLFSLILCTWVYAKDVAINPIKDKATLNQFVKDYKKFDPKSQLSMTQENHIYRLTEPYDMAVINLYKADINNDGNVNYILTYEQAGSMGDDTIGSIFSKTDGKLVPIQIPDNPSGEQMYLFFGEPFLFKKNGLTYINFADISNATKNKPSVTTTCQYLWQGKHIKLINVQNKICATNDKAIFARK